MKKLYFLLGLSLLCSQVVNSQQESDIIEGFKQAYITPYLHVSPQEKAKMFNYVQENVYPVYKKQLNTLESKAQLNHALNQLAE